jgi:glycosyltransferase involved in cell wall biosynthesis
MQQTDFPFVCAIVDDASTDGEQIVLRGYLNANFDLQDKSVSYEKDTEYGHVTFARHKTNENCFFAVTYLKENHYSQKKPKVQYLTEWMDAKYIALCEGDDYWTDPQKLQKQVSFLEEHLDYSLCCHRYKIYNQNEGTWDDDYVKKLFEKSPNGFSFSNVDNLNRAWITKTVTLVYRNGLFDQDVLAKYQYRCDEHLNYHLLRMGLGYCFPFIGAVYRRHSAGVYSVLGKKDRLVRWCRIREEMLKFNLSDEVLKNYVYHGLRKYLYNRQICCEELGVACVVLKSFYLTEGLGKTIVAAKKIIGSCVNGLMRKNAS